MKRLLFMALLLCGCTSAYECKQMCAPYAVTFYDGSICSCSEYRKQEEPK